MKTHRCVCLGLACLAMVVVASSEGAAQFRMGKGFGGNKNFGGLGGSGKGGDPLAFMMEDPQGLFERMAKGRDHFLISETFRLRERLTQFVKDSGGTGDKISREQFLTFVEQTKAKATEQKTTAAPSGEARPGGGEDAARGLMVEFEFRRRDANGDGVLNLDEMPGRLRDELANWDRNGDQVINLDEFRSYFQARAQQRDTERDVSPTEVIQTNDDDLDRRPVVYRAGKLPKELESLFKELDTDGDGQIDLAEWRSGNKTIAEFRTMDRNGDGLLTAEEILRSQAGATKGAKNSGESPTRTTIQLDGDGDGATFRFGGGRNGGRTEGSGGPGFMKRRSSN